VFPQPTFTALVFSKRSATDRGCTFLYGPSPSHALRKFLEESGFVQDTESLAWHAKTDNAIHTATMHPVLDARAHAFLTIEVKLGVWISRGLRTPNVYEMPGVQGIRQFEQEFEASLLGLILIGLVGIEDAMTVLKQTRSDGLIFVVARLGNIPTNYLRALQHVYRNRGGVPYAREIADGLIAGTLVLEEGRFRKLA